MEYIGIDIGSTAAKVYTVHEDRPVYFTIPTGWSSKETSRTAAERLAGLGIAVEDKEKYCTVSTGYGRQVVDYADRTITEITCHGRGGSFLAACSARDCPAPGTVPGQKKDASALSGDDAWMDCTIVDVGGQDTKVIITTNGTVSDFLMNDKCAAGTGKFIELMANRLNMDITELFAMAEEGTVIPISALCTVFAESEVISLIGQNRERRDIAAGVVDSVVTKVAGLCQRRTVQGPVILTGGLSQTGYFAKALSRKLGCRVLLHPLGLYAGAIGARLCAMKKKNR